MSRLTAKERKNRDKLIRKHRKMGLKLSRVEAIAMGLTVNQLASLNSLTPQRIYQIAPRNKPNWFEKLFRRS